MARFEFRLPDVGEGTAEAEIVAWHVNVGDRVEEDQPLADVMTDKATVEITAPVAGIVLERNGEPGIMAAIGSTLIVFETDAEADAADGEDTAIDARRVPATNSAGEAPTRLNGDAEKVLASPAVRRRAKELGLDLAAVKAAGAVGRITHAALDAFLAKGDGPHAKSASVAGEAKRSGSTDIKLIGLRRRIAEQMQESKRRIPHFAYVEECDVTELEALRAHLNAGKRADQPKLTLLPFLIRAMVRALPEFPQINATFDDEAGVVTQHAAVHAGIATQTPGGLVVPVVKHAEARDVWGLAREIARLAEAARAGKAARDELSGSTITITSLGPLGGVATTPVINRPEVAIVGPNKIIERPVVHHGAISVRKMMNISSSFDHRVVDGYDAALFIQRIKAMLEHPATIWM